MFSATSKCAVEETGRNSVSPSTRPNKTALNDIAHANPRSMAISYEELIARARQNGPATGNGLQMRNMGAGRCSRGLSMRLYLALLAMAVAALALPLPALCMMRWPMAWPARMPISSPIRRGRNPSLLLFGRQAYGDGLRPFAVRHRDGVLPVSVEAPWRSTSPPSASATAPLCFWACSAGCTSIRFWWMRSSAFQWSISRSTIWAASRRCWASNPTPKLAILVFGLVHGFGLATKVQELNPSRDGLAANMISFNVGVEIGQLLVLSVALAAIVWWRKTAQFSKQAVFANAIIMAAGFALMEYQLAGYFGNAGVL